MSHTTTRMASFDGVELAVHEMGAADGRPVMLLHGLFSNAHTNWIKYGHAGKLADAGFRVIMPDLRAHGESAAPQDAAAYPMDVLVRDMGHLIAHYELTDFDLGGFSLGARTTARLLAEGVMPRRAILAGMGLEGLTGWNRRSAFFLSVIERFDTAKRGDPEWLAIQFMKTTGMDKVAAGHLLRSIPDTAIADFGAVDMPVLVLCGEQDRDNGDPAKLAEALPNATLTFIPGTHMSSVVQGELGDAMTGFLSAT
jgi:pimeloyl-ACP methyl ester carboxylesterase